MNLKINLKSLPAEVVTLICSFGYPEYKEHIKEICHQLTKYTGTGLLEYNLYLLEQDFHNLYRMNYVRCIQEFLTYAVDEEVLQDLFKQCTKCCCCSKHGHNRPINYYTNDVSIGESFNTDETCHCKCRSVSRNIQRVKTEPYRKNDKKNRKCRKKSIFNIQFIPLSSQIHHVRARFHPANQPILP